MKKYKLIKIFPASDKLGTVYNHLGNNIIQKDNSSYYFEVNSELLKEFWQEIVEKDYEILSFKSKNTNKIAFKIEDKFYFNPNYISDLTESYMLLNKDNIIHSVKRLSDGEIFTIGDKVEILSHGQIIIDKITINKEPRVFLCGKNLSYDDDHISTFDLLFSQKAKQKLFTTEDGVDIFKGDVYFIIEKDKWFINTKVAKTSGDINNKDWYNYFSTRAKAEEYLIFNKPCLSIEEVIELGTLTKTELESLKLQVKEKLKQ